MKFQDSSFNGLKVTVGTKSVTHPRTHAPTHARSKSNMPHQLFQSWGHKKTWVSYFFMRNPHMKFQDSSFNGLKVTVGTKSVTHPRTHPPTHAPTHAPKAICPINFFKVGGIMSYSFDFLAQDEFKLMLHK